MTREELVTYNPRLYHMAEADSWPSIQRHGLLSVSALLDLFDVDGESRTRIEARHRPASVSIEHAIHGRAVIRDQIPLPESSLRRCLVGMTPEEWYRFLNAKAFFWASESRVETLLAAKAYRNRPHCVLTVDTETLVNRYEEQIELSPMNSGSAKPFPHKRGRFTFCSIRDFPFHAIAKNKRERVVEVTVPYAVPDVREMILRVEIRQGSKHMSTLFDAC